MFVFTLLLSLALNKSNYCHFLIRAVLWWSLLFIMPFESSPQESARGSQRLGGWAISGQQHPLPAPHRDAHEKGKQITKMITFKKPEMSKKSYLLRVPANILCLSITDIKVIFENTLEKL